MKRWRITGHGTHGGLFERIVSAEDYVSAVRRVGRRVRIHSVVLVTDAEADRAAAIAAWRAAKGGAR